MPKLLRATGIATIFVFVGLLVGLLAACEHKAPATSQPTAAPPIAALPDTAHLVTLSPQDSIITIGPVPASPAPDYTLQVEESKAVTPELSVTVKGTLVSDAIPNPQRVITIRQRGQLIYADTSADFLYAKPFESGVYPLWVPTGQGAGELLLGIESPPDLGFARRFFIKAKHIVKADTLPIFEEKARNLDEDPRPELGGRRYSGEVWDDGKGHYYTSYSPKLYYEVRPTGLVLDTALTKRKAIAQYGVFRGFEYSDKPGIRVKQPK